MIIDKHGIAHLIDVVVVVNRGYLSEESIECGAPHYTSQDQGVGSRAGQSSLKKKGTHARKTPGDMSEIKGDLIKVRSASLPTNCQCDFKLGISNNQY
jgi:hypothetical protein